MNISFNSPYPIPAAAGAPPLSTREEKASQIEQGALDSSMFYLDSEEVIEDSSKPTSVEVGTIAFHLPPEDDNEITLNPRLFKVEEAFPEKAAVDLEDQDYVRLNTFGEVEFFIKPTVVKAWQEQLAKVKKLKKSKGITRSNVHIAQGSLTQSQETLLDKTSELQDEILTKLFELKVKYAIPNPLIVKNPEVAKADFQDLINIDPNRWVLDHVSPQQLYFDKKDGRTYRTLHMADRIYHQVVANPALIFYGCFIPNSKYNIQGKEAALFAQAELRVSVKKQKKLRIKSIEDSWEDKAPFKSVMRLLWANISTGKIQKDGSESVTPRSIDTKMLRRILNKNSNSCADWNPTFYKAIVHLLKKLPGFCEGNEKIHAIDPSLGWGGRLIGALGTAEIDSITGFDPNTSLIPGYKRILQYLAPLTTATAKILVKPSEEMTAKDFEPNRKYKLILTSPPYAHLEEYSDEETQSIRYLKRDGKIPGNPEIARWLHRFMFRMLFKAWKRLDTGGVIALNLADITVKLRTFSLCEPTLAFLNKLGLSYRGCIGLRFFNTYEPIWIFQKGPENQKYGTYALTFKSSDNQTIELIRDRFKDFAALPPEEQVFRQGFYLPKLYNTLRKYHERQVRLGINPNIVEAEITKKLGMPRAKLDSILYSPKQNEWRTITGKGDAIIDKVEPEACLSQQVAGLKRSHPIA